ncbi:epsin-1 [Aplysia californica]|uniref:Epsin-1 n=1 Tax=Aplysia californica TaxID=6500 RepID=A0ABM1AD85_APLCA|nr:epsin-1 [Aplysia californica]
MPAIRRTLKNVVKNYSDAQVKVREATSNDPWGPSSTLMSEIADLSYNVMAFTEIMQMVWKRLNDDGKNWRHVYKSLVVLDYIIKTGSEKVAQQCKENFHAIKTLTSFQYIDADNKDQGMNVREKAKHLVAMLSDDERLKNERAKALKAKERFAQNAMGVGNGNGVPTRSKVRLGGSPTMGGYQETPAYPDSSPGSCSAGTPSEIESARPSSAGEEELQLQLALAMSKEEHDEQQRKQKSDDIKLQMAIEQSREHVPSSPPTGSTLLDLAGPSSSGPPTSDPWGMPLPASSGPPTDPWGGPLPAPTTSATTPDPWGSGAGGAAGGQPPPYSAVHASAGSSQPQSSTDAWGMPVAAPSPHSTGAWSNSTSPVPQASAWGAPAPAPPAHHPQSSPAPPATDPFGAPLTSPVANGTSPAPANNNIDTEFDLLSSRSNEPSPTKSPGQGLEEFDLLAGGSQTNGSAGAFDMSGLGQDLGENKKKSAEDFLGANANLVNLDQLVSKAPPKGNNPFAMTTGNNNPFQDPSSGVRLPMAAMHPPSAAPGFSQPVSAGLLPAPLLPVNQPQAMQPQAQQNYNPFL